MNREERVPLKNYIILAIILILSILAIIYFYRWYDAYENSSLSVPYMDKYLRIIKYNELDNYLMENRNTVIYVSKVQSEEIRLFEKKFKNIINTNSLNNTILYLNVSDKENKEILSAYNITSVPCIILFSNEEVTDIYNIKDNGYDIDKVNAFLVREGIIND